MTARKITAALIGGLLLAASFTPIASAKGNNVVSEGDNPADFLYWEDGFLVMTGSALDFCIEEQPPTLLGQVVAPNNGSLMLHTRGIVETTVGDSVRVHTFARGAIDAMTGTVTRNRQGTRLEFRDP
jgi:hypothetical protein